MTELPTGTVTFLFTDIEGSTRLLQDLGRNRYREVLGAHTTIMRRAVAANEGVEIRTEGDSFFVVFPTATGALRAAVFAQRDLAVTPIRVRMGLHTGEGNRGGDDYVGIDVNRAARIAAAGHGGQVLLSDATRALVEHDLPKGTSLRDLGDHRLKDIAHPEHLFDLVIEGLPSDFPALRSVDARPNNLPSPLTSFVGRDAEVAETIHLLGEHRLVTLTGPGGTGKTRLAVQVAGELLPSFAEGAYFVDLATIADPGQVCPAICQVLGVREKPGTDLIDELVNRLEGKELLLLLDNFEHLLESSALVDKVLGRLPELRVLVTSRIPLGLYGEHAQLVPPLALPDPRRLPELEALTDYEAVALFIDRAGAARTDFAVTSENARAVAEICARLDGLPLAIELAASRIKVLTPDAILSRLGHSLDLLTAGARNLPERQRTLRAAIEWSYDLLDEPGRRLFVRLSVFSGDADLEAIDDVANPGGELGVATLDGLASLIDESLVRRSDGSVEPRFGMLETIRQYAAERCDLERDCETPRRRHAHHFLALAEEAEPFVTSEDQIEWLDRLDRELENLQGAFRWAIEAGEVDRGMRAAASIWRFWQQRGYFAVGRTWLERFLAQPGERTASRAKAYGAAGSLAYWQTDAEAAEHYYEESLAIYSELRDRLGIAEATYNQAFIPILRGTGYERSLEGLQEALELFEEVGDQAGVAKARANIPFFMTMLGDYRGALPLLEEAVSLSRRRGDMFHLADDILGLAQAHRMLGNHDHAHAACMEALGINDRADSPTGVSSALEFLAALESDLGRHERALRLVGAAEAINEATGGAHPPEALLGDPVGAAREALGDEAMERARAEGRAMSRHQAVAYARSADA